MKIFIYGIMKLGLLALIVSRFAYADFYVIPIKIKSESIKVSQSGGDFSDPVTAMESITDASSNKPYLIYIDSGTYILNSPLRMKPFVSIVGNNTILKGAFEDADKNLSAVVHGENNTTLSNITIENDGKNATGYSIAFLSDNTSPLLNNVKFIAKGGAWNYGMNIINASAPIVHKATFMLTSSTASQDTAIGCYSGSELTLRNSTLKLTGAANSGIGVKIINSKANISALDLNITITGEYTEGLRINNSTFVIDNASINVSGGTTTNYAVRSESALGTFLNTIITATGNSSYALNNWLDSNLTLLSCELSGDNRSLSESGSQVILSHSLIHSGNINNDGSAESVCYNTKFGTVTLEHDCTFPAP